MTSNTQQTFADKTSNEKEWFLTALQLRTSSKLIGEKADVEWTRFIEEVTTKTRKHEVLHPGRFQRVHMMLAAFALENLFKYQYVRTNRALIYGETSRISKLPEELKSHDLLKLAKQVSFHSSAEDEHLLERLSFNSSWNGRYPTPTNSKDFDEFGTELYWSSSDTRDVEELIDRVIQFIDPDYSDL